MEIKTTAEILQGCRAELKEYYGEPFVSKINTVAEILDAYINMLYEVQNGIK